MTTRIFTCFLLLLLTAHARSQSALLDKAIRNFNGKVGVCAIVLETGDSIAINGTDHFPMQSVYKFPIAMAVLDKVDHGKLKLSQPVPISPSEYLTVGHSPIRDQHPGGVTRTVAQLLDDNIVESDGTACDVLLRLLGGTDAAQRYLQQKGFRDIAIATTEEVQQTDDTSQYRNFATPVAMTGLFRHFFTDKLLSASSRKLLMDLMINSGPGVHRIKGQLPAGTTVAHKTGTSATLKNGMTPATNDAGIITLPNGNHIALTVFITDSFASQQEREKLIATIAKIVWDAWQ